MNALPLLSLRAALVVALLTVVPACTDVDLEDSAPHDAARRPETTGGVPIDPAIEARIDRLMARMTVEEMVAQTIQGDINSLTPDDIRAYHLGSVLNGGNSAPRGDVRAPAPEWLALADELYAASTDTSDGGVGIPLLWGIDSVHGQNDVVGATLFPHNIGLGAARNPDLIRRIGAATAVETIVTGQDWTFAPTLAVVQDDRWGRTYESYAEAPAVVAEYARAMVEGLEGKIGTDDFLSADHVLATAKHFLGDGGTEGGKDQGDNRSSEADLMTIHGAGYPPAISAGVQVVMASFSSWQGEKMHGNHYLLTEVLKGRMGFNGFVVGDWNGHAQVPGCEPTSCAAAFNAGIDMFMAPDSWKGLYENTLAQVKSGVISAERLHDAVRRILRVKFRAGLFEKGKPSSRPHAGAFDELGSPAHRALARRAVRESLVLLKNEGGLLPLDPHARILVAGDGANDIGKQSGGWSISWQGTGNTRADFPHGTSIWDGLREAIEAAGGSAVLSVEGAFARKPDAAVVVFGEDPYAEFMGDVENLDFAPTTALALLKKLRAAGIPTVSVFLSGRPLWVNPELNASTAFVAAWLPGTEGAGVADVLLRKPDGSVHYDFRGKLSFSWPKTAVQTPLNPQDAGYDPLFAYGFGLTYADDGALPALPEESGLAEGTGTAGVFFEGGVTPEPWVLEASAAGRTAVVEGTPMTVGGALTIVAVDRAAQEDARRISWTGAGVVRIAGPPADFSRESNGDLALSIDYRVDTAPEGTVTFVAACGEGCGAERDVTAIFAGAEPGAWTHTDLSLRCLAEAGVDMTKLTAPFGLRASGRFSLSISGVRLVPNEGRAVCPGE
ncbi:glycoside hydrolase family 3 protein [Rhodocaloribacter sp.]